MSHESTEMGKYLWNYWKSPKLDNFVIVLYLYKIYNLTSWVLSLQTFWWEEMEQRMKKLRSVQPRHNVWCAKPTCRTMTISNKHGNLRIEPLGQCKHDFGRVVATDAIW